MKPNERNCYGANSAHPLKSNERNFYGTNFAHPLSPRCQTYEENFYETLA